MNAQLKKGVLEMCILYQLRDKELYGYQIMRAIKDEFSDVYDGSVYAILRRLNAEGYTETYIRNSPSGHQGSTIALLRSALIISTG